MDYALKTDFLERLGRALEAFAREHIGAMEAPDVSQQVMVLILEKGMHQQLAFADLERWAFKTARNLVGNYFQTRTGKAARTVALEDAPEVATLADPAASPYEQMLSQERSAAFERACTRLPEAEQRFVALLKAEAGREEMMAALGVDSAEELRHRNWRLRNRLRAELAKEGY